MGRRAVLACSALAVLAAGCTTGATEGPPTSAPTTPGPSVQQVVKSRHPIEPFSITDLWVRRDGDRVWVTDDEPPRPIGAGRYTGCSRVTGDIDICTTRAGSRAVRWTADGGATWTRAPAPVYGVLPWFVPSLAPDTLAIALGGDGATVFPLLRVISSEDHGTTWTTDVVPEIDNERRATTGHALMSDGRLLVIVGNWSDDEPRRPSNRHHGFFVSDPSHLGNLHPYRPTFSPPLRPTKGNWPCCVSLDVSTDPDPVLWTTTWDRRLYYSTDNGRSFTELPIPWLSSSSDAARW